VSRIPPFAALFFIKKSSGLRAKPERVWNVIEGWVFIE